MLYRAHTSRRFVVGSSTLGAVLIIGLCVLFVGVDSGQRPLLWLSAVAASDAFLTTLDRLFHSRNSPDAELLGWGWARAIASGARGAAWGLGPILLYKQATIASVMIPFWGLISLLAASAYTAGPFFPGLVATVVCGVAPPSIWLALQPEPAAHLAALLLALSVPFICFVGAVGRRNSERSIAGQLELAAILDLQKQQTRLVSDTLAERTRFFTAAGHDLRQPLQALEFYASIASTKLRDSRADPELTQIVDRVEDCVDNLNRQFNAILGVAGIEAAIANSKSVATPLQAAFERSAMAAYPEAELKNLQLTVMPTAIWVSVDPALLQRVLSNLLSNAVKFTSRGRILLGARRRGAVADIWVLDTGPGIPEAHHDDIFKEYYQIHNKERAPEHGFGLGLAIVRRICSGLHWPLQVRSTVGRGSSFRLTVAIAAAASAADEGGEVRVSSAGQSSHVVIVDDDDFICDSLERLLRSWGWSAMSCRSAEQAIDCLRASDDPRAVILLVDYRLGGQDDGLAVIDRIRVEFGAAIRAVLMTGDIDSTVLSDGAKALGIPVLRKPIKPIRLRAVLTPMADTSLMPESSDLTR